ncbi:hypothetical protein PpBr36_05494 [Pyricularia pennisetigena]|uniref:hypothetical protein n=1 Tax=Pyricularia pennisetigena TaxID=1578925 RepID=UPI0011520005|nr:hypothetical protein PpBr36_05494 [Pyricularia pennisetigena]TLS26546.1 hypothetical protein PpBr36_05494 [Pyricularia pennisetigena]
MPLPLRLRHIPIPCSTTQHTPLQMACWLQSRTQQAMNDRQLKILLALPIGKKNNAELQKRGWIKKLLAVNVPNTSSPSHIEHLLKHVGPPPTVISFMPQPAFDVPGLARDADGGQKAQQLAATFSKLMFSHDVAHSARSLGIMLPDFFTWDQLRKVIESLLDSCDKWRQANMDTREPESLSMPPSGPEELARFLQTLQDFTKSTRGFLDGAEDASPSVPLVTDLAAKHRLQPKDWNPAFFGPATLMLWPVMDLKDNVQLPLGAKFASDRGLHDLLAEATIRTIKKCFRRDAFVKPSETGVWVDDDTWFAARRIATVRPILGANKVTSFGVGLQVGPLPKEVNNADHEMISLAEIGDVPYTPASLASHWVEELAGLLSEKATTVPKGSAPEVKVKEATLNTMDNSSVPRAPAWTVDHLEDSALGWRAQSHFDSGLKPTSPLRYKGSTLTADSPLTELGQVFDSESSKIPKLEKLRRRDRTVSQTDDMVRVLKILSALAQGRPWLGVDKNMEAWHTRPIDMTTISNLKLDTLDHRAVIPSNSSFPKMEPVPEKERVAESELIWPDLAVPEVDSIDQQRPHDSDLEAAYKHYCAWLLRVLRESSCGRQLDARLTDHSARYVEGEMMANPSATIAIVKGSGASIAKNILYGLNYMQCAAVYRRVLTPDRHWRVGHEAPLSRQEARLVFPENRWLIPPEKQDLKIQRGLGSSFVGGLSLPETLDETLSRLERFPGSKKFSINGMKEIEARYGKEVVRAAGIKKAPATWQPLGDVLGRI